MNILMNFLYKEAAGPVFTLEMARGLALNGCNVYAVLSSKIANREDWEKESLIKSVCFIETGTRKTAISSTVKFYLYKKNVIKKFFDGIQFDYVIQTFYHPWISSVSKQVNFKKSITLCHDPVLHSGVKKREIWATKRFVNHSDEIVVLTESFIPLVIQNYKIRKENIHFMPHGRMGDYKKNQKSLEKPIYDNKKVNFLFFGRIGEYKGLHILAQAFKKLEQEFDNVHLTVAGSGDFSEYTSLYNTIKNLTLENRYIQDEEVGNFFDDTTVVLVLPYLDATQSGVTPIALEYNVPVIASDSGGLMAQLDDGNIGMFVEPANIDSLYNAMKLIVLDEKIVLIQRTACKQYIENLNWNVVTRKLLKSLDL